MQQKLITGDVEPEKIDAWREKPSTGKRYCGRCDYRTKHEIGSTTVTCTICNTTRAKVY